MKAAEIRAAKFECDNGAYECARWLQEIAAQLAEINERAADDKRVFDEMVAKGHGLSA